MQDSSRIYRQNFLSSSFQFLSLRETWLYFGPLFSSTPLVSLSILLPFFIFLIFLYFDYIFFRKTKKITSTSIQWEKLINDFGMHYLITKCSDNIFLDFRIFKKTLKIMKMTQMHQKYIFWIFGKYIEKKDQNWVMTTFMNNKRYRIHLLILHSNSKTSNKLGQCDKLIIC